MKRFLTVALILFSYVGLSYGFSKEHTGSTEDKGTLRGKVTDYSSAQPLPGVSITVKGTNLTATTSLTGEYYIDIPVGSYQVEFSYIGYDFQTESVEIKSKELTLLEVKMINAIFELQDVTIERLQGQAAALNQQKTSDNIKNIVASDQIGRFPDPNVAEALQRVSGINVIRDEGEGRYVLIRGLSPEYSNISINGEQIPSPEGGVRYIALDAIPADQIASMEIVKNLTPDMDGDAIGGSVNLITKSAESSVFKATGTLVGEYNNLMKKGGYAGALSVAQRIAKGKFGYMLNASYYVSQRGGDRLDFGDWTSPTQLSGLELRDFDIDRKRLGLSSTFDYKFNDRDQIYLRTLFGQLDEHEYRRRIVYEYDDEDGVWEVSKRTKDRPEIQGINTFNLGGTHTGYKISFDYEVAYALAKQNTPYSREVTFKAKDLQMSINTADPLLPVISPILDEDDKPFDHLDNSNYEFDEFKQAITLSTDQNITGKINVKIPFDLNAASGFWKFGGKARFKERKYGYSSQGNGIYELADEDDVPAVEDLKLPLSDFDGGLVDNNFHKGNYKLGSFPDINSFKSYFDKNQNYFVNDEEGVNEDRIQDEYTAKENVYAAYLMGRIQFNKLMVSGGLRYEATSTNYKFQQWDEDEAKGIEVNQDNEYHYLLPMVHLKYNLSKNTNLRAAATYSYARPNFEEMTQLSTFSLSDKSASLANPNLKPVNALNLDLFAEHYLGNIGILSFGVFYKKLDNFISKHTYKANFMGVDSVSITQAVNGDKAYLYGAELSWQQNFTFLPGVLSGLGIYANYTFTSSEANVHDYFGLNEGARKIDIPGQSDHVGNFALSYMKGGFNARVIANFNGKFVEEIEEKSLLVNDERIQIDFSLSQSLNSKAGIFMELINLTNQRQVTYSNSISTPRSKEYYGFWGRIGVKYKL